MCLGLGLLIVPVPVYTLQFSYPTATAAIALYSVHYLAAAWPRLCQPITEELKGICFALIGPW